MRIYLVGGAVRDRLLGLPVRERDWVVVGATPAVMQAAGYRPVGRDFPVFLHPQTNEEYALARTERKTAPGHQGFAFHADPDVSLEADLERRDLTVNAIAEDDAGHLIDPFDGARDLDARILRHVSSAFVEDPLRVLRVARFAARFHQLGFRVAPETLALMQRIAQSGELASLSPERVWKECERALATASPLVFFQVLAAVGALQPLLPLLAEVRPGPETTPPHPAWKVLQLDMPAPAAGTRLVALVALAARDQRDPPGAGRPAREPAAGERAASCCDALRVPRHLRACAAGLAEHLAVLGNPFAWSADDVLTAVEAAGLLRQGGRLADWVAAEDLMLQALDVSATARAATTELLQQLPDQLQVDTSPLREQGYSGPALGQAIRQQRLQRLQALLQQEAP